MPLSYKVSGVSAVIAKLSDTLGGVALAALFIGYVFGGFIGAVWAAIEGDLLNVVLSIFIPMWGAGYVVYQLLN